MHRLTQADMVLIALFNASRGTTGKVAYEDLVLEAWRTYPGVFSLRNHPEFPDASDIHKRLYQTLRPKGLVMALGSKSFRLTEKGLGQARNLAAAVLGTHALDRLPTERLARGEEGYIGHAVRTRAFERWTSGQKDKLVDYDAGVFFQFSTGTQLSDRIQKVNYALGAIEKAKRLGVSHAQDLAELGLYLRDKFRHLFGEGDAR